MMAHSSIRVESRYAPGWGGLLLMGAAALLVMAIGLFLPELGVPLPRELAIAVFPLAALSIFLAWMNERLWVYTAVASHLMMMVDSTRDAVGIGELSFGFIGLIGLVIWLVKEIAVARRRIIETGFDLLLFSFMFVSTITTLIMNVLHGGDLVMYFKEYGVVFDLLLYFPLKKVLRTREDVLRLLAVFIVIAIANGFVGLLTYRERLAQAVFQWQVTASRSNVNESTSLALFILGSTLFAYANRMWLRVTSLALAAGGLVFLLVSFSRSPIVAAVLALMIIIALIPLRNGKRVVVAMACAVLAGAGVAYLLFPQIVSSIGQSMSQRILSVAETTSDRSFNARLVESSSILRNYFRYSPLLGVGFGVNFKFLDPLTNTTVQGVFVHNGYIWSIFKYGVPLALMFLGMLLYPLVRLLHVAPRRYDGFNRGVMAGAVAYLICGMMVHFTSNLMTQVSTVLNVLLCWALLDFVQRETVRRRTTERSYPTPPAIPAAPTNGAG